LAKAQPLFTSWAYLRYLNRAVDGHQIHSPFVFKLYEQVIKHLDHHEIEVIEKIRKQLIKDRSLINVTDYKNNKEKKTTISKIAKTSLSKKRFSQFLLGLGTYMQITSALETGTSLGINTLYLENIETIKKVVTIERNEVISNIAIQIIKRSNKKKVEIITGDIYDHFEATIENLRPQLIFLDADHRQEAIRFYLDKINQNLDSIKVIVIHDIYWSKDINRIWLELVNDNRYPLTVDIFQAGLIFPNIKKEKQHFTLKF
jgi:predicted O-methyltransferase YrrM